MLVTLPVGQLHQAQPIAAGNQPHRLGVDGNRAVGELHAARQVFLMEMDGHPASLNRLR